MKRLGLNTIWIKWIKICLESSSVSISVKHSPTKQFRPKRDLRQGDRMTLFLFFYCS